MAIGRRRFLRSLILLSIVGLTRSSSVLRVLDHSAIPISVSVNLTNVFSHKKSARMVGLEYLRSVPGEADINLLVKLICSFKAERYTMITKANAEELRRLLLKQFRKDFAQSRVVKVQGWILSETEARLCALAALV
ncbi:MAG: hypothetical protein MN733_25040 [Nitrososphaera sp.]|nr:hypothetical protein [Nitrososphaera sp.]